MKKHTPQDWAKRLDTLVMARNADLADDSMSRINFDCKEDWRKKLPVAVVGMWPVMSETERKIAFVCASAVTHG